MAPAPPLGCRLKLALLLFAAVFSAQAATYFVTVSGLGGDAEYEAQFARWAGDLDHQLKLSNPDAHVETLTGASATREHLRARMADLASGITADDAFALLLIGHGSFDGTDYKFNVPGPDITANDLREWLAAIKATRQLIVNMTSCSGASMPALASKNRIVITATKSGNEKNAPVFPRFFIDALHDSAADTDKNGVVTALEAYDYAQQKTAAYFASEKLIASEHSLFNENASTAIREPSAEKKQGLLASTFPLLRPQADTAAVSSDPAKQKLLSHKDDLEARIDRLKYQKSSLPEADYKQQLTMLLIDLARTQAELDK